MAIHQEAHAAVFSAGMSSACVVDIGATSTSVACIDEGMLVADTRIKLDYGGDDITAALVTLLSRSSFPYKELDLGKAMEWAMMEKLKEKICTFEEVSYYILHKLTLAYGSQYIVGYTCTQREGFDPEVPAQNL
jgi:actin-related protein 8